MALRRDVSSAVSSTPVFFRRQGQFRAWLARHHASAQELLVGFHRKGSGRQSITYPEALDEALCYGWIDAVRRRLDDTSYTIRFTPRKRGSNWSAVNIRHVERLKAEGRMTKAGLAVFNGRDKKKAPYSFENRSVTLDPGYLKRLKANAAAWKHFRSLPASMRRTIGFWIMSAKREATRERRLETLITCSAEGRMIPPLKWARPTRKKAR